LPVLYCNLKLKRPSATNKKAKNPEKLTSSEESSGDKDTDRFDFDTTLEELDAFKEGSCPTNTAKNTEWALRAIKS